MRRLQLITTLISFGLSVLILIGWPLSFVYPLTIGWVTTETHHVEGLRESKMWWPRLAITFANGRLVYCNQVISLHYPAERHTAFTIDYKLFGEIDGRPGLEPSWLHPLGIQLLRANDPRSSVAFTKIQVPCWMVLIFTSGLSCRRLLAYWRDRRMRLSGGVPCEKCGYDLRGSPAAGACPECGAARSITSTQ